MSEEIHQYDIGQWVVHSQYGVGQIKQVEDIPLHGNMQAKEQCFQVQTKNGVFWFPVDQEENPRVRPLATKEKLKTALKTLREPPEDIDAHHNVMKGRISQAQSDGSLKTTLRLVRDLTARHANKKRNILEERALNLHMDRLVREWSLSMGMDENEALVQFNQLLHNNND